jgi:hypothetical protein
MIKTFNKEWLDNQQPTIAKRDDKVIDIYVPVLGFQPGCYTILGSAGGFIWAELKE